MVIMRLNWINMNNCLVSNKSNTNKYKESCKNKMNYYKNNKKRKILNMMLYKNNMNSYQNF